MGFNIGDRVRVKSGAYPSDPFPGVGTYRGDSTASSRNHCVAIELHDSPMIGGAQNGWWNFRKDELHMLELDTVSSHGPVGGPFNEGDEIVFVEDATYYYNPPEAMPALVVHGRVPEKGMSGTIKAVVGNGYYMVEYSAHNTTACLSINGKSMAHKKKGKRGRRVSAKKVNAKELDKLVLGEAEKNEILSVLKQHEKGDKLFRQWGLAETIEYGKGMTFMFYGPPGTGKTWGANCIAKALGAELLIISAAEIQSSTPGEANRNIQQAFATAKKEGKVLFMDECDSLITSRGDVGMIIGSEINTLLTEIEKTDGIVILATNRIETMDEALERRISLIIEFPFPDPKARAAIWKKLLPKKMPLAADVNIEELSLHELSGGQIKNAILQAARLALVEDARKVGKKHFDAAIGRISKSKNLMGSASRYHQSVVADFSIEKGRKVVRRKVESMDIGSNDSSLKNFLKEREDDPT